MVQMEQKQERRVSVQNNVIITVSDSDSDTSLPVLPKTQQNGKKKQKQMLKECSANQESDELVDLSSTLLVEESEESANEDPNFIQRRMVQMKRKQERRVSVQNNVAIITLSDSDSDTSLPVLPKTQQSGKKKQKQKRRKCSANEESNELVNLSSTVLVEKSDESANEDPWFFSYCYFSIPLNAEKENTVEFNEIPCASNPSSKVQVESSIPSDNLMVLENAKIHGETSKDSAVTGKKKRKRKRRRGKKGIPSPIVNAPRSLRPIVIDGSNIARMHGLPNKTFSCKGIKIAVDYFVQRGHPQVTAFVPHYRRQAKSVGVVTTDQHLLEELYQVQHVVFTPSRTIDEKTVACYDDRFIVDLASRTGGVILSLDNYRDIMNESEEFKKTIKERLLMYCFVGDILMIPQDPLGKEGPSLENFLSFPT